MPAPGKSWWHVIWSTYGSWLPGDPRGFRNRHHRIHSSGDYRNPPPKGEHAGLHRYAQQISGAAVVLTAARARTRVCDSLRELLDAEGHRALAIAVCRSHVHLLAELPDDRAQMDRLIRTLKTKSSAAIRDVLPGRVWSRGGKRIRKPDRAAQRRCFYYIRDDQERGATVWTFRDQA